MAVEVKLFVVWGTPNTVDKTDHIIEQKVVSGTVRGEFNVHDPVIEFTGDLSKYNYAEIQGRYYKITSCNRQRTGVSLLTMHTDVLWTYKDEIYSLVAVVDRSYRLVNAYLPDSEQKTYQYTQCVNKLIGTQVAGANFHYGNDTHILLTVG